MMRRNELLQIVGMDAERFNVLRRRGQLPFDRKNGRSWQQFTLEDAFRLRLMQAFLSAGVRVLAARDLAATTAVDFEALEGPVEDVMAGIIGYPAEGEENEYYPFSGPVAGFPKKPSLLIAVNATEIARVCLRRTEHLLATRSVAQSDSASAAGLH
ncbi:MerR family transcriptional regulator [Paracoccus chinensis]|uniref:MerR family transcriptional regulator n=1 Tax=Paracoccus chinensis TaxID=525640 RepID=UPI001C31CC4C|nr:hypothetical protein [Paracoccus chinensis]